MPGWEVRPVKGFLPARSPMHWVNPKHLLLGHNSPNTDSCCLGPPPTSSIIKEGPMDTSPTQIGCLVGKLGLFRAFLAKSPWVNRSTSFLVIPHPILTADAWDLHQPLR